EKIDPPLKLAWKYRAGKDPLMAPVVKNGIVYVGSADGCMYALDLWKGELIWKFQVDRVREDSIFWEDLDFLPENKIINHIVTTACISKDKIFFGTIDGSVYALDIAQQGKPVWKINIGVDRLYSSPLYLDGKVLFGSYAKKVHCLNSETGDILWEVNLDNKIYNAVTIKDRNLFVTTIDEKLYAIDIDSQQIKWKNELKAESWHTCCTDDENLYVAGVREAVYAFDIHTGKLNWRFEEQPFSSPSVADGVVYFAGTDNVFAINARDGSLIWRSDKERAFDMSPPIITKSLLQGL
ncbi:MAG: PQQ-binding-like beta-propeller repeat protein, partial [Nitrospirota bacterium]